MYSISYIQQSTEIGTNTCSDFRQSICQKTGQNSSDIRLKSKQKRSVFRRSEIRTIPLGTLSQTVLYLKKLYLKWSRLVICPKSKPFDNGTILLCPKSERVRIWALCCINLRIKRLKVSITHALSHQSQNNAVSIIFRIFFGAILDCFAQSPN